MRNSTRLTPLLLALFFVAAATQSAIVPLLPRLDHVYGLSPASDALLLAAPGLATLAISMPAGAFADRLGARRVTIAATGLMAGAALAQAAPSYSLLIAGRLAFGLAYGIVWTTGVAWMAGSHSEAGSPRLGAAATSAAVGMVAGPAFGGLLADQMGLSAPFLTVAVFAGALALVLAFQPAPSARPARQNHTSSARDLTRLVGGHPGIVTSAAVLAISGAVGGVTQLLVPLELHRAGFSASATGIAFSAAAGVYILVSAGVIRLGRRATTVRATTLAGLALALSLLPGTLETGAGALVGMLVLTTAPRAVVSTVSYPLATESAARAGLGDGLVIGLLNGTWAAGLILAPLLAGAVDQTAGPRVAYLVAILPGALGALWLSARRETTARVAPEQPQPAAG
ncbi:MAG TPA: MFS transporter [Solirubrobacteraceae bacterium]|nr:MFS transporter [Solirubrobacteraceae bacterium]